MRRHLIYIYTVCAVLSALGLTACSSDDGPDSPIEQTGPVKLDELEAAVAEQLDAVQQGLFEKAKANLEEHTYTASSVEDEMDPSSFFNLFDSINS